MLEKLENKMTGTERARLREIEKDAQNAKDDLERVKNGHVPKETRQQKRLAERKAIKRARSIAKARAMKDGTKGGMATIK